MKTVRRQSLRVFSRTFSICLVSLLCPLLLLLGCTVAETNTRALGFADPSPAVSLNRDDSGIHLTFFGKKYLLKGDVIRKAEVAASYLWTALPREFRAVIMSAASLPELLRRAFGAI